jgi:CRP/FNR family transcriptional regulator, cyclic AMP receptor protein
MTINLFNQEKECQKFAAGEVIFKENERGDIMYVIREGEVIIQLQGKEIDHLYSGEILGEMALIEDNHLRSVTAIAHTDCQLAVVNQKRFLFMVENTPHFALEVMKIIAYRLRKTAQKVV